MAQIQKDIYLNVETGSIIDGTTPRKASRPQLYFQTNPLIRAFFVDSALAIWDEITDVVAAKLVIDSDYSHATDPMARVVDAADVTIDGATARIDFDLDCNTTEWEDTLGTEKSTTAYCDIYLFSSGIASPTSIFNFNIDVLNVLEKVSGDTPGDPPEDYYTSAELDVLLALKADKVGSDDIEITDDGKGPILRFSDGSRIRLLIAKESGLYLVQFEEVT